MGQTPGPVGPPPLFPLPRKGGLGKHPPPVGGTLFAKRAFGKLPFVHLIFVLFLNTTTNRRKTTPSLVLAVLRATPPRRGIAHISGVLSFPFGKFSIKFIPFRVMVGEFDCAAF